MRAFFTKLKEKYFPKKYTVELTCIYIRDKMYEVDDIISNLMIEYLETISGEETVQDFIDTWAEVKHYGVNVYIYMLDYIIKNKHGDSEDILALYRTLFKSILMINAYSSTITEVRKFTKKVTFDQVNDLLIMSEKKAYKSQMTIAMNLYENVPGLYEELERANKAESIDYILHSIVN